MTAADPGRIALAIGDPNGIGPEIAVKAAISGAAPILVGDPFVIGHYLARLGPSFTLREGAEGLRAREGVVDVHRVSSLAAVDFEPGRVSAAAGLATVAYVKAAIDLAEAGHVRAIVACPHNETAVNAAGIPFSGYPELVAQLRGLPPGRVFMMFVGGGLRIVHTTLHERLSVALARLTPDLVVAAAMAAVEALRSLGIAQPRIGLFGINPHAGEAGLFGDDDDLITTPAAERLRAMHIHVEGPIGADLLIGRRDLDAFIAMYHDQGHIPVKLLAGREASALSIGAGLLFSTVGHGSAHDIAGRDIADPEAVLRTLALLGGADLNRP
jgi:4-hydroxy-L-threonine phosphate dehydrogenase PdxA